MKVVERDPQDPIVGKGLGCSALRQEGDKGRTKPIDLNTPSLQSARMEAWSLTKFRMKVNRGAEEV
jgi:hypothetical protein